MLHKILHVTQDFTYYARIHMLRKISHVVQDSEQNFVSRFSIFVLFFPMIEDFQIKLQLLIFSLEKNLKTTTKQ